MARGYPDFFGFSIFPFYGTCSRATFPAAAVLADVETPLITIAGKGILFSGYLLCTGAAAINGTSLIYVDGAFYSRLTFLGGRNTNTGIASEDVQVVSEYNPGANRFVVLMLKTITFGAELRLTFTEADSVVPTIAAGLRYTLIQ